MEINGKIIKAIRPISFEEYNKWIGEDNLYWGGGGRNIFVIDFNDDSTLLPQRDCINCMRNEKCMLSQIKFMS